MKISFLFCEFRRKRKWILLLKYRPGGMGKHFGGGFSIFYAGGDWMSVTEWIICGVTVAGLVCAATYLCRSERFRTCTHCPLRKKCRRARDDPPR